MRAALRRGLTSCFVVTLSTLLVVQSVPATRARAQAFGVDIEGFNFSDHNASISEQGSVTDAGHAIQVRSSPVGASGTFTHSIAIRVPPGRSGMTPSLALTYDSQASNKTSPVGAGWSLGVPSISRSTEDGFPKLTRTTALAYANEGPFAGPSGPLARIDNSGLSLANLQSQLYAPVREHEPVRYEYVPLQDRWIEHLPSGTKRYYGAVDSLKARIVNELGTHTWLLLKERDPDGNTIEYGYHYVNDPAHGQDRGIGRDKGWHSTQWAPILASVRWGANDVARSAHLFRIETRVSSSLGDIDMLHGHVEHAGESSILAALCLRWSREIHSRRGRSKGPLRTISKT